MGSSRAPDQSLGNGLSFPQWMRGKVDSRFDFDNSSFSPPSHDDSFFFIRYQKNNNTTQKSQEGFRSINEVLNEPKVANDNLSSLTSGTANDITNIKDIKDIDFSKHPLPCQPFVPVANKELEAKSRYYFQRPATKSQGTDDGFHGQPALCGKSIVHVANRIMSSSTTKKIDNQGDKKMDKSTELIKVGSRSLPVSPISSPTATPEGSPKSRKKMGSNRYFTGAFLPDREKPSGWLLSSILGQSREILGNRIVEEDEIVDVTPQHKPLSRKKSISSQNLLYFGKDGTAQEKPVPEPTVTLQAKPSELREMNFWSPTSM